MKELEESIMSDKIFVVEIMKQLEEWIMCDKILKEKICGEESVEAKK